MQPLLRLGGIFLLALVALTAWPARSAGQCNPATTCNGHGSCDAFGNCICFTGYAGANCHTCGAHYYNYPVCTFCLATTICNNNGVCNFAGGCDCFPGYAGPNCSMCAPGYSGYPICMPLGTCCTTSGCTFVVQASCPPGGIWTVGGTCAPDPCTGSCCDPSGACTVVSQPACAAGSTWTAGGACSPNPCPQPGVCCSVTGTCTFVEQSECVGLWSLGGACSPSNPCPPCPPIFGPSINSGPTEGGPLTIHGTNFGTSPTVLIGGVNAVVLGSSTLSQIDCIVPPGVGDNLPMVVQPSGGGPAITIGMWSYHAPQVTGISPATIPTVGGPIVITGANFGPSTGPTPVVLIGGVPASVSMHSHTTIHCIAPPGAGIGRSVTVMVGGQTGHSGGAGLSYAAPFVASVSPTTGPTTGGIVVVLSGTNFGPAGSAVVRFNGSIMPLISPTDTLLAFALPPGQGTGWISVSTASGTYSSPILKVTYNTPLITAVSPWPGSGSPPSELAIDGADFGTDPVVLIGGIPTTSVVTVPHMQIRAQVPPGLSGPQAVTVIAGGAPSPPDFFTFPSCQADFNNSGGLTSQDIFDFLAAYFTGCP